MALQDPLAALSVHQSATVSALLSYFAQLVGIQPKQADAKLSFFVDKEDNYTFTLTITISDDDGNQLQTEVHAAANKLNEQNTITAPKLLLTDEQIEQLKDLAEPFMDSIKK